MQGVVGKTKGGAVDVSSVTVEVYRVERTSVVTDSVVGSIVVRGAVVVVRAAVEVGTGTVVSAGVG